MTITYIGCGTDDDGREYIGIDVDGVVRFLHIDDGQEFSAEDSEEDIE